MAVLTDGGVEVIHDEVGIRLALAVGSVVDAEVLVGGKRVDTIVNELANGTVWAGEGETMDVRWD